MSIPHHETFKLIKSDKIESLNVEVQQFEHVKTGAQHIHLASDNSENAFMVTLRTMPEDSTGVAHILEHTALCGSKNYPVRDPFFSMIKRSLNSFMNAMTSTDWTSYPFATPNKKDYDNLLKVYVDAVFFPLLDKRAFAQEGHRLDFEKDGDSSSNLIFKGIVFNEMKGAMDENSYLYKEVFAQLFPNDTYANNSGGEPENIPDLTYEEFVAFHKKHYHPSNAIFVTFGDISAQENQAKLEELVLQHFDRLNVKLEVKSQPAFDTPKEVVMPYACDEEDLSQRTYLQYAWCLGEATDTYNALKAEFLEMVLLSDSSAPLRAALEQTDIAKAPYMSGMSDRQKQIVFLTGVQGSEVEHKEAFEKLVFDVLHKVAAEGVSKARINALLDQLEYASRNLESGSYPFGLSLMMAGLNQPTHYADIVDALNIEPMLNKLREEAQDPAFIKNLVQDFLIDNMHRVLVVAPADNELRQQRVEKEKARLAEIKKHLTEADVEQILAQAKELEAYQQEDEDLSVLPKVTLEDVPAGFSRVKAKKTEVNNIKTDIYAVPTNGIVAQRITYKLPKLSVEELKLLPWYRTFVTSLGVADKSYAEIAEKQTEIARSFYFAEQITNDVDDLSAMQGYLHFSARSLARKQEAVSALMVETMNKVRFDEFDRMREILVQHTESAEKSVESSGHQVALAVAMQGQTKSSYINQLTSGVQSIVYAKELIKKLEDDKQMKIFAKQLQELHEKIQKAERRAVVVADNDLVTEVAECLTQQMQDLTAVDRIGAFDIELEKVTNKEAWVINTSVNFCSKAYKAVPYGHPDAAALAVLAPYMTQTYLHREIREKGGAYGGGAVFRHSGGFGFYSYRDPEMARTLNVYSDAIDWVLTAEHKAEDLESAILTVVSNIDKPATPIADAYSSYSGMITGYTDEEVAKYRKRILSVRIEDLKRVAEKYLKGKEPNVAVITNAARAEEAEGLGLTLHKL